MLWAFQQLESMYHNHVTCIAYGLRRICESIRENYNSVEDFIAALKKILVKTQVAKSYTKKLLGSTFHSFLSSQGGVLG